MKDRKEKIKLFVALALIIVIFAGTFVIIFEISNKNKPITKSNDAAELESQVAQLSKKIDDLNAAISSAKEEVKVETTVEVTKSTKQVAGASTDKSSGDDAVQTGLVNINTATSGELDSLDGIGTTYAQRIIDYREANGGFKSIDEIKDVKGIGDKTFEKIKDRICI